MLKTFILEIFRKEDKGQRKNGCGCFGYREVFNKYLLIDTRGIGLGSFREGQVSQVVVCFGIVYFREYGFQFVLGEFILESTGFCLFWGEFVLESTGCSLFWDSLFERVRVVVCCFFLFIFLGFMLNFFLFMVICLFFCMFFL